MISAAGNGHANQVTNIVHLYLFLSRMVIARGIQVKQILINFVSYLGKREIIHQAF